jgi:hypothetical protein
VAIRQFSVYNSGFWSKSKSVSTRNTVVTRSSVTVGSKNGNFSGQDVGTGRFAPKRDVKMWKVFPHNPYIRGQFNKLQIQVATYVFELSAGNCRR